MLLIRRRQHHGIKVVDANQLEGIAVACLLSVAVGHSNQTLRIGIGPSSQLHPGRFGQHAGMQLAEPPHDGETN